MMMQKAALSLNSCLDSSLCRLSRGKTSRRIFRENRLTFRGPNQMRIRLDFLTGNKSSTT